MKSLVVQGATGSIGSSTLGVVRAHPGRFRIVGIAGRSNVEQLVAIASEFKPEHIALEDRSHADRLRAAVTGSNVPNLYLGDGAAHQQALETDYDLLVAAQSGRAGLEPILSALTRGKSVAIANKESLVVAGPLVMQAAFESGARVIPIDSEHSAIYQCLLGEKREHVRRIWLTTSGGPFWGYPSRELDRVTPGQALAHPTWKMGPKITVDSATLFNKGLEVIEAQRLFELEPHQIEVVVHRQSVVHSMVEFDDGSIKAQLSRPDMRLPILFALSYPERASSTLVETDVPQLGTLTFEPVSVGDFPCLDAAREALRMGGTAPAAVSAADEIAVDAFLNGRIRFTDIAGTIENVLQGWSIEPIVNLNSVIRADSAARELARDYVRQRQIVAEAV